MTLKYLVRAGNGPFERRNVIEQIVSDAFGSNLGNLLYANSVYRTLMTDSNVVFEANHYQISPDRVEEYNETCKAFIIPLADAFREDFLPELRNLTRFIRSLKIPCVVVGVGIKASYEPDLNAGFPFDEDVKKFVHAVLEKSSKLGLRGDLTAKYLSHLGFKEEKDFTVIGCPSMYFHGAELKIKPLHLSKESTVCINSSIYLPETVNKRIMSAGMLFDSRFFIAQQTSEIRLAYAGTPYPGALKYGDYPGDITHPFLVDDQYRAFTDIHSWMDFMGKADFSFGGRLHGNIAAVLSGTPALMVCTDARMRELSAYHGLAAVSAEEFVKAKDFMELASKQDYNRVVLKNADNLTHFCSFLKENRIDSIYEHHYGSQVPYDEAVSKISPTGPIKNYLVLPEKGRLYRMNQFYSSFIEQYSKYEYGYKQEQIRKARDEQRIAYLEKQTRLEHPDSPSSVSAAQGYILFDARKMTMHSMGMLMDACESVIVETKDTIHYHVYIIINSSSEYAIELAAKRHSCEALTYHICLYSDAYRQRADMNPLNCYETNVRFWESIFEKHPDSPVIQEGFIYNLDLKLRMDILLPRHYSDHRLNQSKIRLHSILKTIPADRLALFNGLDNFHRYYYASLLEDNNISVWKDKECLEIRYRDECLYRAKKLEIIVTRFKLLNRVLSLGGFIKSPVFSFIEKPELILEVGEKTRQLPLQDSSWCYLDAAEKTNRFFSFNLSLKLKGVGKFRFKVRVGEITYQTYFYFMPDVPFNIKYGILQFYDCGKKIWIKGSVFHVGEGTQEDADKYYAEVQERIGKSYPEYGQEREMIRNYQVRNKDRRVWLYYANERFSVRDSGFLMFQKDCTRKDGIDRYLVLQDQEQYKRAAEYSAKGSMIVFGSNTHKELYGITETIVTPDDRHAFYNPYDKSICECVSDLFGSQKIICVPDNVSIAYRPWTRAFDRVQTDLRLTYLADDRKQYLEDYGYTEDHIMKALPPKYGMFNQSAIPQKRILYMPGSRPYLVREIEDGWIPDRKRFVSSVFYKETCTFLSDSFMREKLKEEGFRIDVMLPPELMCYRELYKEDSECIQFIDNLEQEEDYCALIFDITGIVYDFLYLKRHVACFVPDYQELKAGMNGFGEGGPLFWESMGPIYQNTDEITDWVAVLTESNAKMRFRDRRFCVNQFSSRNNSNYDSLYRKIISL